MEALSFSGHEVFVLNFLPWWKHTAVHMIPEIKPFFHSLYSRLSGFLKVVLYLASWQQKSSMSFCMCRAWLLIVSINICWLYDQSVGELHFFSLGREEIAPIPEYTWFLQGLPQERALHRVWEDRRVASSLIWRIWFHPEWLRRF